jgi:hypothetical protein
MSDPNTTQDYLDLITSEYQGLPNFEGTISAVVSVLVQIQILLASIIDIFDLDLMPVGDQLDIIGQWVGVQRQITTPILGVFFTWDDVAIDGWDSGTWQDPNQPDGVTILPDDAYLTLINATIAINTWDGTTNGIYDIWASILPQYNLIIQDNQNMSFNAALQGVVPDALTQGLFENGYLVPRPEGVRIAYYITPVDTNPIFAWDSDSEGLAGWDTGSWAKLVSTS